MNLYPSLSAMAETLAASIAAGLRAAVSQDNARLILPGGSSPLALIAALAAQDIPWSRITVSTTDERRVPLNDPANNAGQVSRLFSERGVDISLRALRDENPSPDTQDMNNAIVVLGMGTDGHIASLFGAADCARPGSVIATRAPNPPHERLSLTLPALLAARRLVLLVPGGGKMALCRAVLAGKHPEMPLSLLAAQAKERLELHGTEG